MIWVAAAAATILSGCTKHIPVDRGDRYPSGNEQPGGQSQQQPEQTLQAVLRSDWSVKYLGREDYTEDDGSVSEVERFQIKGMAGADYTVRTITIAEFDEYYQQGDYLSYIKDEATFEGDVFSGDKDILFDRMRHGDWYAFVLGVDTNGDLTGEYNFLRFNIEEEVASDDYLKWLGNYIIGNGEVNYKISVTASENNLCYFIDGWETGASISSDGTVMDQEWFETFYDKVDGKMYFVSQYIGAYDDDYLGSVEELFMGKIHYTGNMHEHDDYIIDTYGLDLASVEWKEEGAMEVVPCDVVVTFEEGDTYRTSFYKMQYLCYSYDQESWYDYNSNVPALPLVMTRVEAAPASRIARSSIRRRSVPATKAIRAERARTFVPKSERTGKAVQR